jgi:hypothetical protein
MQLVEKIDDYGKPAWIVLMILGFVLFWPIGLAILLYMIWSGRMRYWKDAGRDLAGHARRYGCGWNGGFRSTGNRAFDEYRTETLRRLEDEQKEFTEFLERLRKARDKTEFDQFMAERRSRGQGTSGSESPQPAPAT